MCVVCGDVSGFGIWDGCRKEGEWEGRREGRVILGREEGEVVALKGNGYGGSVNFWAWRLLVYVQWRW